jgi:hypothetical protein
MAVDNYQYGSPAGAQTRNPFNYEKFEQIDRDNVTPWLTLEEITQQINLYEDESQDPYLKGLELATRQAIEDYLGLSIFSVSYRVWYGTSSLAASPVCFDLPAVSQNQYACQPEVYIDSLAYWTDSFPPVLTAVAADQYYYDASGNKVIVSSLPTSINTVMTAPIVLEYTTVPNPISAYPVIKQAGLLLFTHLYNNRANATEVKLKDIPFGVTTLLRAYKPLVM